MAKRQEYNGIRLLKVVPNKNRHDWLPIDKFCEEADKSKAAVKQRKANGKFDKKDMIYIKRHENLAPKLYLSRENCLMPWVREMKAGQQPQWYLDDMEAKRPKKTEDDPPEMSMDIEAPANYSKANQDIIKGILSNKKAQLEHQMATNAVIAVSEVKLLLETVALAFRQAWASMIPRTAPKLAAEKNTVRCTNILEQEGFNMFEELAQLDKFLEDKGVKNGT